MHAAIRYWLSTRLGFCLSS